MTALVTLTLAVLLFVGAVTTGLGLAWLIRAFWEDTGRALWDRWREGGWQGVWR